MEKVIFLDTHTVIWLYAGQIELFSDKALTLLERNDLLISPMVELELNYLNEVNRITVSAKEILIALKNEIGLTVATGDFQAIIEKSLKLNWTRDPFDRLIVAQAALARYRLLTKDQQIHQYFKQAVW